MRLVLVLLSALLVAVAGLVGSSTIAQAATMARIVAVGPDGNLYLKEPGVTSAWTLMKTGPNLWNAKTTANRISVLERTGNTNRLWVKEGGATAPWTLVSDNVGRYEIAGDRIAVIFGETNAYGSLYVKEGALGAGWTQLLSGAVLDMELTPTRIGVLVADGEKPCTTNGGFCNTHTVFTKNGPISAGWRREIYDIDRTYCDSTGCQTWGLWLGMTDNRIILDSGGYVVATEGDSPLITLTEDAVAWDAADTRFCATIGNGGIYCKLTSLTSPWVKATDQFAYPVLGAGRFGWVTFNGRNFSVADSTFSTTPTLVMGGVQSAELQKRAALKVAQQAPKRG